MESTSTSALVPVPHNQSVLQQTTKEQTDHSSSFKGVRDPISVLPPEIAWRCIYEALPLEGETHRAWYPEALLQFTTVSRSWGDLILSTSSFWAEIHVHIWAEDMLAILATFLGLSRESELSLVIWTYPGNEWDHVRELLLPHVPRFRTLNILIQAEADAMFRGEPIHTPLLTSSAVIKDLNLAPFLRELDCNAGVYGPPYCPNLGRLIALTASRLTSLVIRINASEIGEVAGILPLLTRLQDLGLHFYEVDQISDMSCTIPQTTVPCLRSISVWVGLDRWYDPTSFDGLFAAFSVLYPCVAKVTFNISLISNMMAAYLERLQHLETLHFVESFVAVPDECRELFLPTLQELDVGDSKLVQFIKAPNLISLRNVSVRSGEELEQLQSRKLQSLHITIPTAFESAVILRPDILNALRRLTIVLDQTVNNWVVTSLPLLASIQFGRPLDNLNRPGKMLCAQIIYYPETCPSLREIDFGDYVEWDLLFIMLERRNLGRKDATRIEKVSVPFVPLAFRQSLLELLLGRQRRADPSNMVLSLEETRELIFDPSVYVVSHVKVTL
ncbi:hypothetical protein M408DRAFT_22325 [Serendipita vermifera MAFF 305830]|uniref:F-box domain-containing protein n=1 Tax=Serendipita vermifera MAFF 305830 TaxID=933852 RepID=A0A0C2XMY4_SERVB|nr:hypothetical protein M408DRAFT_22325 [Serendipita vermifera MAFF 305830]